MICAIQPIKNRLSTLVGIVGGTTFPAILNSSNSIIFETPERRTLSGMSKDQYVSSSEVFPATCRTLNIAIEHSQESADLNRYVYNQRNASAENFPDLHNHVEITWSSASGIKL